MAEKEKMPKATAIFHITEIKKAFEKDHLDTEAEALQMGIDALQQPKWIPCSERLPEKENVYIVCFDPDQLPENVFKVDFAYWLDGKWQYEVLERYEHRMPELVMEPFEDITVIAWMPLPEPWRGEEHG